MARNLEQQEALRRRGASLAAPGPSRGKRLHQRSRALSTASQHRFQRHDSAGAAWSPRLFEPQSARLGRLRLGAIQRAMDTSSAPESFRSLFLRHRGRTGLIQRDLAARVGVSRNALQDWESGVNYPTAERLQSLIRVLLGAGGLTDGRKAYEARQLWAAAEREAPRMHTPFDEEWFARVLATRTASTVGPPGGVLHGLAEAEPVGGFRRE
jgi:transcriptional regulator with XRE-family HTH domain